jgi:hypothetical protein
VICRSYPILVSRFRPIRPSGVWLSHDGPHVSAVIAARAPASFCSSGRPSCVDGRVAASSAVIPAGLVSVCSRSQSRLAFSARANRCWVFLSPSVRQSLRIQAASRSSSRSGMVGVCSSVHSLLPFCSSTSRASRAAAMSTCPSAGEKWTPRSAGTVPIRCPSTSIGLKLRAGGGIRGSVTRRISAPCGLPACCSMTDQKDGLYLSSAVFTVRRSA